MISGESYLGSLEIELLNGISKLSLEIPNLLVIYKIVLFNETHTNTNKLTNWINFVVTRVWGINVLSFVVQKLFKGNSSRPVQRGLNNPALEFPNWVWKSRIPWWFTRLFSSTRHTLTQINSQMELILLKLVSEVLMFCRWNIFTCKEDFSIMLII